MDGRENPFENYGNSNCQQVCFEFVWMLSGETIKTIESLFIENDTLNTPTHIAQPIDEDWCDERNKFLRHWSELLTHFARTHRTRTDGCILCQRVRKVSPGEKKVKNYSSRWIFNNAPALMGSLWPHRIRAVNDLRFQQKQMCIHSLSF